MQRAPGTTVFSHDVRVAACDQCGAPLETTLMAAQAACRYCGAQNQIRARNETVLFEPKAPVDEVARIGRLRMQDGRPYIPPAAIMPLLAGGEIPAWKINEATQVWLATRRELRAAPGNFDAAERLYALTLMIANALSAEPLRVRAIFEGALEALTVPRHKQVILGQLSRQALRTGDIRAAEEWIAGCDRQSDDIESDSAYRISIAFIETAKGRFGAVLSVLGADNHSVPIADMLDVQALVLRANALERLGRLPEASHLFAEYFSRSGPPGRANVESVLRVNAQLALCQQSFGMARAQHGVAMSKSAAQNVSGGAGCILMFVGLTMFGTLFIVAGAGMAIGDLTNPAILPHLIIWPLLGILMMFFGYRSYKGGKEAAWLMQNGIPATALIQNVAGTGLSVNDVPQVEITVLVQANDRPPFQAKARMMMSFNVRQALVPGAQIGVRFHPQNPGKIVLEAG